MAYMYDDVNKQMVNLDPDRHHHCHCWQHRLIGPGPTGRCYTPVDRGLRERIKFVLLTEPKEYAKETEQELWDVTVADGLEETQ